VHLWWRDVSSKKVIFVMQNLGEFGARAGVKIYSLKCHIWNRRPWFAYSLYNFYTAIRWWLRKFTLGIPIVKHFRRKKPSPFWAKFWLFLWINSGLIWNLSFITPKGSCLRDFTSFELSRVKNPSTGLTCRRVWEKNYK